MKREIYFPKGAESIEFNLKQGIATAFYPADEETVYTTVGAHVENKKEEVELFPKVGEWWDHNTGTSNLILEIYDNCEIKCVPTYGDASKASFHHISVMACKSNMKEVEKLLIGEYENKGGKKDVSLFGIHLRDLDGNIIFNGNTGLWSEIIEEKKPIYTNSYGTSFYKGDKYFSVSKSSGEFWDCSNTVDPEFFGDTSQDSELLTERECHQYLADNWDKFNK